MSRRQGGIGPTADLDDRSAGPTSGPAASHIGLVRVPGQ